MLSYCLLGERIENGQILVNKSMPIVSSSLQTGMYLRTFMMDHVPLSVGLLSSG